MNPITIVAILLVVPDMVAGAPIAARVVLVVSSSVKGKEYADVALAFVVVAAFNAICHICQHGEREAHSRRPGAAGGVAIAKRREARMVAGECIVTRGFWYGKLMVEDDVAEEFSCVDWTVGVGWL